MVSVYRACRAAETELAEARLLVGDASDPEMAELASAEVERIDAEQAPREARLHQLLLPKDPLDDKNVIVEIRAGTGGMRRASLPATCSGCTRAGPMTTATRPRC